jgi:hypothetical protein
MKKVSVVIASIILIHVMALPGLASWIPLAVSMEQGYEPVIDVLEPDQIGTVVELNIQGVDLVKKSGEKSSDMFDVLTIPGCSITGEIGAPAIPVYSTLFGLEKGIAPSLEIMDAEFVILDDLRLFPRLQPVYEGEDPIFDIDPAAYRVNEFTPGNIVTVGEPETMRNLVVSRLTFYPVQYNPVSRTGLFREYRYRWRSIPFPGPIWPEEETPGFGLLRACLPKSRAPGLLRG